MNGGKIQNIFHTVTFIIASMEIFVYNFKIFLAEARI
jgi:hypothetical protein